MRFSLLAINSLALRSYTNHILDHRARREAASPEKMATRPARRGLTSTKIPCELYPSTDPYQKRMVSLIFIGISEAAELRPIKANSLKGPKDELYQCCAMPL